MIRSYKDLTVWQKGVELSLQIYRVTKNFPKEETYSLISQIRRAAVSIPSNIAEGSTRHGKQEYIQFLYVALASGAELETQLLIAKELNYVSKSEFNITCNSLEQIMKMLNSLISKLKLVPNH